MKHEINIDYVTIDSIKPYPGNTKRHPDSEIEKLSAMIEAYGFDQPIVVDKDMVIIKGHGRLLAHRKLGSELIPIVMRDDLSPALVKASRIADNKSNESEWDLELLAIEFEELKEMDFDLELTGFDLDEIEALMPEEIPPGLTDEDEIPEPPVQPVTKLGDVWLCGKHRVMCGDSTSIDAVEKLMNGNKADILFTDPPYGISFKPQRGTHGTILNDALNSVDFDEFLDSVFCCALSSMKPDTYAFIWTGWSKLGAFEKAISKHFKIQAFHIWVKNNFGIGYYSRPKHEPFYLALNGKPVYPSKAPADVWEFEKVNKTIHSCEKPVGLIINILDTYHKNSCVLDLFGGSGSTLIACEKTNRINYSMELDEKYCDVIVKRWQDYTGKLATLESTGELFNDLAVQ